jgi:DNA polymerase III subunit delta
MPKPVYALIGSDSFLQTQHLQSLLQEFGSDVQRIDLDGEKAQLSDVLDELRSFAMFGGEKLVIVRDADAFVSKYREQLEDYLGKPATSGSLVLRLSSLPSNQRIYKAIAKVGKVEPCEPPKAKDVPAWIVRQGKDAHGVRVDPDAAEMLAELIGDDLGRIDTELAKLALQVDGGRLTSKDVTGAVAFQRQQQMWDMTNELAAGHADAALRRWRQLMQTDPSAEFRAVTWLGMWLENVRKALAMKRKCIQPFAIAQALRLWPREIQQPFFKTADALGEAGVARAINLLAEIDKQSKSGVGDAAENVERFLLSLAVK